MSEILYTAQTLTGKRILVVGGSGSMGLSTARLASAAGANVIISGRSESRLEHAAKSINDNIKSYVVDATSPTEVIQMVADLAPLDHIVVAVSSSSSATSIPDTSPEDAQIAFSRFWVTYNLLYATPGHIRPNGSIVLLSGSSGRRPVAGFGVWAALHAGIEGLVHAAALELAPIRVNGVSPGGINMVPDRQLTQHQGNADDIGAMIIALMLNPAVTNTIVDVDGGERLGT